jgi:hypothetical protein
MNCGLDAYSLTSLRSLRAACALTHSVVITILWDAAAYLNLQSRTIVKMIYLKTYYFAEW